MQIDAALMSPGITDAGELASDAETLGFDGVWVTETSRSSVTLMTRIAEHTDTVDVGTAITVAFPRSPMVTAYAAWDLQELADGRFILGLGTQVKGHIERRFDVEWSSPGPRLRDYIGALRAIWKSWEDNEEVDYDGEFYEITLCPPDFRPEPIADPDIPVYIAGVNPYNLQLAGAVCDGLHVHPLNSPEYIEETVVPNVKAGADTAGRELSDVTLATSVFAVTGDSPAEREQAREAVRKQISFYGSTRTYQGIFDTHGWGELSNALHELSVSNRWDEMPALVSDEVVATFSIEGHWDELADKVHDRYSYIDRVSLYTPFRGEAHWGTFVE